MDAYEELVREYRRVLQKASFGEWCADQIVSLRQQLQAAEAENVQLRLELEPIKQQFEDWAAQNREYHAEAKRLAAELANLREWLQLGRAAVESKNKEMETARAEIDRLLSSRSELAVKLEKTRDALVEFADEENWLFIDDGAFASPDWLGDPEPWARAQIVLNLQPCQPDAKGE